MDDVLRGQVILRAHGGCEWCAHRTPPIVVAGEQIAHLHSRGIGGNRKLRDVLENMIYACDDCALMTDGIHGSGGSTQYRDVHLDLFGSRFWDMPRHFVAWERAEALRELIQ